MSMHIEGQGDQGLEYELPAEDKVVHLAALEPRERTIVARGAADNAFRKLFTLPFANKALNEIQVHNTDYTVVLEAAESDQRQQDAARLRFWGNTSLGVAAATAAISVASFIRASQIEGGNQMLNYHANDSRGTWRNAGVASGTVAITAAITGLLLHRWSE